MEKYQVNYYIPQKNNKPIKIVFFVALITILLGSAGYLIFKKISPSQTTNLNATIAGADTTLPTTNEETQTNKTNIYAPILLYHHIAKKTPQNSYYVSPEIFEKQLKWLKENNFKVISMDELYQGISGKNSLPKKPVVITFDDGYVDNYKNAFPLLKKYAYTATFFVKTNTIGKGDMSWQMLKEMQDAGMTIASHSMSHQDLKKMKIEDVDRELLGSKQVLEKNLGVEVKYFSYPLGAFSSQTAAEVKKIKYLAAFTVIHRVNQNIKTENDYYKLPRVHIDDEMPTFIDWVQGKNLK